MGRQSLKEQLFDRTVDGDEVADRIMLVLRHSAINRFERTELLRAHFLASYHMAHWENDMFDFHADHLSLSPFRDRAEIVSAYSGGRPLLDRKRSEAAQTQAAE